MLVDPLVSSIRQHHFKVLSHFALIEKAVADGQSGGVEEDHSRDRGHRPRVEVRLLALVYVTQVLVSELEKHPREEVATHKLKNLFNILL